jgi:hypothetical protein
MTFELEAQKQVEFSTPMYQFYVIDILITQCASNAYKLGQRL